MAGTERSENNGWEIEKDGWNQRHLKKMSRKDRSEKDGWNREIRNRWLEQRDQKKMEHRDQKRM